MQNIKFSGHRPVKVATSAPASSQSKSTPVPGPISFPRLIERLKTNLGKFAIEAALEKWASKDLKVERRTKLPDGTWETADVDINWLHQLGRRDGIDLNRLVETSDGGLYLDLGRSTVRTWLLVRNAASVWPEFFDVAPANESPETPKPQSSRRGRKPYDWDLFHTKCIQILDDDAIKAHDDVNIAEVAGRLMLWGNDHVGENKTPADTAMRTEIAKWVSDWKRMNLLEEELARRHSQSKPRK